MLNISDKSKILGGAAITRSALVVCLSIGSALGIAGCDAAAWTRGQPPSSAELVERSGKAFDEALASADRADIKTSVEQLKRDLLEANTKIAAHETDASATVDRILEQMMNLEQKVSVTSRPAMAELGGELRAISSKLERGEVVEAATFGAFTSRVFFLLANELTVPAPLA